MTTPGKPRPKPTDSQIRAEIAAGLMRGLSYGAAGELAGISRATIFRWLAQGRKDDEADIESPFRDFRDSLARAYETATSTLESKLYDLAKDGKRPDITLAVVRARSPEWRESFVIATEEDDDAGAERTQAEIIAEIHELRAVHGVRIEDPEPRATRARKREKAASRSGSGEGGG